MEFECIFTITVYNNLIAFLCLYVIHIIHERSIQQPILQVHITICCHRFRKIRYHCILSLLNKVLMLGTATEEIWLYRLILKNKRLPRDFVCYNLHLLHFTARIDVTDYFYLCNMITRRLQW